MESNGKSICHGTHLPYHYDKASLFVGIVP